VRLVGYSGSDFEGIGLKKEEVELWISYFITTLNRWGIRCATFSTGFLLPGTAEGRTSEPSSEPFLARLR
jgi:hypothetical protein